MHLIAFTMSTAPLTLVRPTPIVVSSMASLIEGAINLRMCPDLHFPKTPRHGFLWFPSSMVLTAIRLLQALYVHPRLSSQLFLPYEVRMLR